MGCGCASGGAGPCCCSSSGAVALGSCWALGAAFDVTWTGTHGHHDSYDYGHNGTITYAASGTELCTDYTTRGCPRVAFLHPGYADGGGCRDPGAGDAAAGASRAIVAGLGCGPPGLW